MGDSPAERHAAALQLLQDLTSLLNDVETPGDLSRAQADYNAAEERHSREQNPERKRALCRELVRYGDRLEEIEHKHKAAQEKRKEQLDLFDSRLSKEGYKKLVNQASSTGTGANRDLENDRTTHQISQMPGNPVQTSNLDCSHLSGPSNDRATHETTQSPQTTGIRNTIEPRSTPSRTHSATPSRGFSTDVDQQLGIEPTDHTPRPNKRTGNTSASRLTKRHRESASSETVTQRTITFDKVYQDGKARQKHRIVKIQGLFYVFGCEKHEKHFCKDNPHQAAMSHLKGKGHACKRPNAAQALRSLGTQVLECTDARLELNNDAANIWVAEQEEKNKHRKASTMNLAKAPQTDEIHMAWFGDEDKGYCLHAFLVMPFFPRPNDGMDIQSVTESNLDVDIPACYKLNETSDGYDWAEGYEEHGKYANNRVYPIMCLVGEAPHKVDWLPVCHFRKLDLEDEDLEDKDVIKAFMRKRTAGKYQLGNDIEDESEDLYEDSTAGDNYAPTSSRDRQSPIGRASENISTDQGIRIGSTAENQESTPLGPKPPTQVVKDEPATVRRGDGATSATGQTTRARQPSVQRRWPAARKGPPNMETLDSSDSE
ncbi:hypothetical protein FMEXI_691 [Fusarium mexicanum]|uniref:Uncharacterized protein n=1 Tax=Fusarium mexicanum TaxID=751941 RepID=A0A8H5N9C9_9HYPO|nr:hypothetical protein FMEXI_691 [Fusarium mexicanum]